MGPIAPAIALGARLVLAAAFFAAGLAKLAQRDALPDAVAAFGVPSRWSVPVARALPVVEVLLAAALVVFAGSAVPGWIAVVVLALFGVAVVRAVASGAPCPCFGVAARRASWGTVLRNGALLALAVVATGGIGGAEATGVVVTTALLGVPVALLVRLAP